MAKCLNDIMWAEKPLDLEAPYRSDHTMVEDSDVDESPKTKAARNRRRETIGRRYLLGHMPLIQTASLRGPFGSECGWVAPWNRIKACPETQEPQRGARNQYRAAITQGAVHTKTATFGVGNITEVSLDEDSVRYDADNEDDVSDEINDADINLPLNASSLDGEHAYFPHEKSYLRSVDGELYENSKNDSQWLVKHNDTKHGGIAGQSFLQSGRKRKREAGWLKGVNVLKRSRYETLEHSSPTPVVGTVRVGNIDVQSGPYLPKSDLKSTSGKGVSLMKPTLNTRDTLAKVGAINGSATLGIASGCRNEISLEMEEGAKDLWAEQLQSTDPIFCYSTEQQTVLSQSMEEQQPDPDPLGSYLSNIHAEGASSSKSVLDKRPQRAGTVDPQAQGQDFEGLVYGDSAISGILDNESVDELHLDNKMALNDLISPFSEDSFHYRKTNQRYLREKTSPQSYEEREADNDVDVRETTRNSEPAGHDARNSPTTNDFARHSINHTFTENGDLQVSSTMRRRRSRHRQQHRSKSPDSILAATSQLGGASSPDPLCGGPGSDHVGGFTPELIPAKSLQDDVARIDRQHTTVAQAISISPQEVTASQAFAFRRLSEEPVAVVSRDHMKISSNPNFPTQHQLRHSLTKLSNLPAKIHGADEVSLAPEFPCHGGSLKQQEPPTVNNAPNDLSLGSQQPNIESRYPISSRGSAKPNGSADRGRETENLTVDTLPRVESELVQDFSNSVQSPWIATRLASSSSSEKALDRGSYSSKNDVEQSTTKRALPNLPLDSEDSAVLPREGDKFLSSNDKNKDWEASLQPYRSFWGNPAQSPNALSQSPTHFPSTQNLVDAATINPWKSVLKKPSRRKSDKRVSFGVLPFDDVDGAVNGASSKSSEPMGSPPPPAGTLRLTQLDDPFHHRLRATRDLEVTEESLTKFMNTPWNEIPPTNPPTKPLSSSPATVAMADAFIAADQQSHFSKINGQRNSNHAGSPPATAKLAKNLTYSRVLPVSEPQICKRSPTPDASFSIAPSGKVTAVSIGPLGYDAEDNLHAVIEDMGTFLAGWDVESELKKAKGHNSEKGSNINAVRKREYLLGVSNR